MRRLNNKRHEAIIQAIIDAPVACVLIEDLARRLGLVRDLLQDSLATLEAEDWISSWDSEEGLFVTLSTRSAATLRVELVEYGRFGNTRWKSVDDPTPSPRGYSARGGDSDIDFFELVPDPAPPPDIAAELAEVPAPPPSDPDQPKADGRIDYRDLPAPTIFLGLHVSPFPGPGRAGSDGSCPICGSSPRRSNVVHPRAYCLWCDRWGQDEVIARSLQTLRAPLPRPIPTRRPTPNVEDAMRRQRKERRRNKHQAKWSPRPPSGGKRAPSAGGIRPKSR